MIDIFSNCWELLVSRSFLLDDGHVLRFVVNISVICLNFKQCTAYYDTHIVFRTSCQVHHAKQQTLQRTAEIHKIFLVWLGTSDGVCRNWSHAGFLLCVGEPILTVFARAFLTYLKNLNILKFT